MPNENPSAACDSAPSYSLSRLIPSNVVGTITPIESTDPVEPDQVTCCQCGRHIYQDDIICHDDENYCESCESECFGMCARCEDSTSVDDLESVHAVARRRSGGNSSDQSWCSGCRDSHSWQCQDCQETFSDGVSHETYSGEPLCERCYESSYFYCEGCDDICHMDDYGGEGYCQSCSDDRDDESGPIQSYSTRAEHSLSFIGNPKDRIYYGIELEVEASPSDIRGEKAEECISSLGDDFIICKEDGSLGSGGFEIVTAPASLDIQRERWGPFLDHVPSRLRSWESGKCGMHVHVSRRPLSKLTIGKILEFVNSPANNSFITRVAGRESCHWCKIQQKKVSDISKYAGDRYQAVNLTNPATIEFRIFRGTLKKTSFLRNLEFVAATVAFCKQAGIRELTTQAYFQFVNRNRADYPTLANWLVTRGHLRPFRKPIPSHVSVA